MELKPERLIEGFYIEVNCPQEVPKPLFRVINVKESSSQ
jgi:hypothetical protein